jgi:hypothetical protein
VQIMGGHYAVHRAAKVDAMRWDARALPLRDQVADVRDLFVNRMFHSKILLLLLGVDASIRVFQ